MQLKNTAKVYVEQVAHYCRVLKTHDAQQRLMNPTFSLFTSINDVEVRARLFNNLPADQHASLEARVNHYRDAQKHALDACLDILIEFFTRIITDVDIADDLLIILNFIADNQLRLFFKEKPTNAWQQLNPGLRLRLSFSLLDQLEKMLLQCGSCEALIADYSIDETAIVMRVEQVIANCQGDNVNTARLHELFENELQIREASIMARGDLPTYEDLCDVFMLYKVARYPQTQHKPHRTLANYYALIIKTLSQLSMSSRFLRERVASGALQIAIKPIREEVSVGPGLVRCAQFGVQIAYEDGTDMRGLRSNVLDDVFTGDTHSKPYRLSPQLKLAIQAHTARIKAQIAADPVHAHQSRRIEKLAALESVLTADDFSHLSPASYAKARAARSYLFVAWGQSHTQTLIEHGEAELRKQLWEKLAAEVTHTGEYGHALTDKILVERLLDKHARLTQHADFDISQDISALLNPDNMRASLSGYDIWHFDKKTTLEIILIAHAQSVLHPRLFCEVEAQFQHAYARTLPCLRASEVEDLVKLAKADVLTSFWLAAQQAPHQDTIFKGVTYGS